MNPTSPWRSRVWIALALVLTSYKLWLTRGQGIYAIGSTAQNDRLFLEFARHLVQGSWLGPYNELTLAKGPFYPLFIAAAFGIGLPLFLAQQVFYATACALFARALRPAIAVSGVRCAIYTLLLWNPMTFDAPQMGRVLRQHVEGPLALMMVAGLAALYLRRAETARRQAAWAVLLGLAAGGFYLTGGERAWFAPALVLLGAASLHGAWKIARETLRRTAGLFSLAAVVAALPVLLVCIENQRSYGRFSPGEQPAAAFSDSSGAPSETTDGTGPTLASADFVVRFSRFSARPLPSTGSPDELNLFRDMTGERLSPPAGELDVVGAAEYLQNVAKVDRLQAIGKSLRLLLLGFGILAHLVAVTRLVQATWQRRFTFSLTIAMAVWSALATALVMHAGGGSPMPSIAAFAPLYPLLLVFIAVVFWDALTAWYPWRPPAT